MTEKEHLEKQTTNPTFKQKVAKALTGTPNPSRGRVIIYVTILWPLTIIFIIMVIGIVLGWGSFVGPMAKLSINNAISAKSFTATVVDSNDKELYSIKYNDGIYYSVQSKKLTVWTFNDDETVKYLEEYLDDRSEQEVLNELKTVEPFVDSASVLGETCYLLCRAISVDKSTIQWMGDMPTVFHLARAVTKNFANDEDYDIVNTYGAQIELPNNSITCVVAYQLKLLKLNRLEIAYTNSASIRTYYYNISKTNNTKFDFKFKN